MNIATRYLAREVYAALGLVLGGFVMLFAFFDLIRELDDLGRGNYGLPQVLSYVALGIPSHVYELLPIGALIGALYALSQLSANSELTVLRVSGLSTPRLLRLLGLIGLPIALVTLLVGEFVAPVAEKAAQRLRMRATSAVVAQEFQSGLWVKDGSTFVNVREVRPDAQQYALYGVKIYSIDDEYRLASIRYADSGEYIGTDGWELRQVVDTRFGANGIDISGLPQQVWRSVLTPEVLSVLMVRADRMSISSLYAHVRYLGKQRQRSNQYEIAMWKKLLYPFATFVMLALALPFAFGQTRSGGVGLRIFIGVMLGVLFHHLNSLFSFVGQLKEWPAPAAAALPSAVFLITAGILLWLHERR